jgi:glutamate-1-semialdehyde 2,1-aminomutase
MMWKVSVAACAVAAGSIPWLRARVRLWRAKPVSAQGHPRIARRLARLIPACSYTGEQFFSSDGAAPDVVALRRQGFERLSHCLERRATLTIALGEELEDSLPDLRFTKTYRVPFQYAAYVKTHLKTGSVAVATSGVRITNLDGSESFDLTGSYGMNVFGYDFYKACIDAGADRVKAFGPVLGTYHPVIQDNVRRLKTISKMDAVSFHMSGTEAVMQAVQLARYHTGRSHVVRLAGSYHGWWDGVQPGVGNPRVVSDVYTLRDLDERTLDVLRTRRDIACVLVNPLQALHPNRAAPADASLIAGAAPATVDRTAYAAWLRRLRAVCTARSIVLIFDEVFVGFRIAYGGAQEYFGVDADLVTYGKTLGGGLPIGVLCGKDALMKRFRDDRPSDICFARGTFNSHPYVMGSMNEFLRRIEDAPIRDSYQCADATWSRRAASLNARLESAGLPVRVSGLVSIWTIGYLLAGRYHWMLQYYLAAEGLALSWVGSGRLVFSHDYTEQDFAAVSDRFVAGAQRMRDDGWWSSPETLTDAGIRRRVLREMLAARVGRAPARVHG